MSLNGTDGKKYGLIIPSKKPVREPVRTNIPEKTFEDESDDEEDAKFVSTPSADMCLWIYMTKINLEKALEEDATVFQYDEVYDEINREKDQKLLEKSGSVARKPRYVSKLLKASAVRKLEKELLTERKAQREIEAEKEKYGDKESFVTGAYKLVEKRREEEAREAVMDVTKQDGLGGFYRYMFQQKTGSQPSTSRQSPGSSDKVSLRSHLW
ncbi:unnamed protein product [Mesocestoides corti]|uniref:Nuclear speckle splicing regulatory protein 1 N-terminal domain-containing protein n=1 Tax=Mesocestoides corti TaxID=53468 RepID=A0A0R3UKT1_MESCO|nr:unnamed protein product [Mesocestoides corti]